MPVSALLIEIQRTPPLLYREREMTIRLKAGCADHYSPRKTLVLPNLTNIRNRWHFLYCLFLDAEFFIKFEGLNIAL